MPVNVDKMQQDRAKRQRAGELLDMPEGDTLVYIAAGVRDDDDVPYWETKMHYGLGLGPKGGNSMAMCLEPAINPLLTKPGFIEQCEAMGKDLSGGCAVCERLDKDEPVTKKEDQDGKPTSRWLWIVVPRATRGDARQKFAPWPKEEIKGLLVGYRVWDGLSDLFGSLGDITDMDKTILAKITRTGKKLATQWGVGPDIETTRKPISLPDTVRQLVADNIAIGAECDPYRMLASMARERKDVEKLFDVNTAGEYEETGDDKSEEESKEAEAGDKGKGKFTPPGKGTSKPATGAKPASKPADNKVGAKAAKPETKGKDVTKPGSKQLQVLIKERGGPPPNCYQIDPDPAEEMCQKCVWKKECADHLGVPVPPDYVENGPDAAEDDTEASNEPEGIAVEDCEQGSNYVVEGETMTYKGPAKGAHLFVGMTDGAKPIKLQPGTIVHPVTESDGAEPDDTSNEDEKMAELEKELAARKAAKGNKK